MKETFYTFDFPLSVCLLADIHDRPFTEISASLEKQRPDIIAVAGDILFSSAPSGETPVMSKAVHALDFLYDCAKHSPTFMSVGNHEWMLSDKDKEIIFQTGGNTP